jgi:dihydrofolate reductase
MSKIVVFTNLTLDGVMQAPGRADEDTRGGFKHGGWAAPYQAMSDAGGSMSETGSLLMGRRTYEDFYSFWPKQTDNNPFTPMLNNMQKYVASTTLNEPLEWQNSTLLKGDVPEAVKKLKKESDKNIMIMGSGVLVQSLMKHNLIDEYILLIHPLVLGSGRRLFNEGELTKLKLSNSRTSGKGVIIATYVPENAG